MPNKTTIRNHLLGQVVRGYFKPARYTSRLEPLMPTPKSIPIYQLLKPDGTLTTLSYNPDNKLAVKLFDAMVRWSVFDQVMNEAQRQGRISFYLTSDGEEAISFGSAAALQPNDMVFAQYREGGVLNWRGYPMQSMVDQCFANARDKGKGRQMPVHYGSSEYCYQTVSSTLATQIPQAAGAGYGYKLDEENRVAVCYFGEGAASEGDFHAGVNFGAVLGSQTLFICRNNQWAISTPTHEQYAGDGIAVRGPAYGIPSFRVDGNDLFAVMETIALARKMVMERRGPVLVEAISYRMGHHSTSDDSSAYRDKKVIEHVFKQYRRLKKHLRDTH